MTVLQSTGQPLRPPAGRRGVPAPPARPPPSSTRPSSTSSAPMPRSCACRRPPSSATCGCSPSRACTPCSTARPPRRSSSSTCSSRAPLAPPRPPWSHPSPPPPPPRKENVVLIRLLRDYLRPYRGLDRRARRAPARRHDRLALPAQPQRRHHRRRRRQGRHRLHPAHRRADARRSSLVQIVCADRRGLLRRADRDGLRPRPARRRSSTGSATSRRGRSRGSARRR